MQKTILITGAAKRIGATCARLLHAQGYNILLHYRNSRIEAQALASEFNALRSDSAKIIAADLLIMSELTALAEQAQQTWGGIDVLINNASAFYATDIRNTSETQWHELIDSNLKAPFFLTTALANSLAEKQGCVVNMIDIHAERGLKNYAVYSMSKAGLVTMTKALAKELAPQIRVNAIAPGAIIWPEQNLLETEKKEILHRIALGHCGSPDDIAKAVRFLIDDAPYMTGQVLTIDGGRTLFY